MLVRGQLQPATRRLRAVEDHQNGCGDVLFHQRRGWTHSGRWSSDSQIQPLHQALARKTAINHFFGGYTFIVPLHPPRRGLSNAPKIVFSGQHSAGRCPGGPGLGWGVGAAGWGGGGGAAAALAVLGGAERHQAAAGGRLLAWSHPRAHQEQPCTACRRVRAAPAVAPACCRPQGSSSNG